MPTPWQRELATIFTPMRWRLDLYWNEIHRDSMLPPQLATEFADWLLTGDTAKVRGHFDSDFLVGDFDRDIACHSWIFLGTGALIVWRFDGGSAVPGSFPALAIAHALACLDADADLYAALNRVMEQVANQARSNASYEATTMRTLAASLQGRGKGNHIKLAALFKALRKAHHQPGERRGSSQEIDDIEQSLSRIKSPPRSKRALDTLYDAARLVD